MNFHGVNFTDSGGFQMYSKYIYISSNDSGVTFRNPFSGEKLLVTPEKDMQIQLEINSDVGMCLDSMPMYGHSKKDIEEAVRKTILWAERCKAEHDKLQKNKSKSRKQLLFGIIQGGIYKDLREKCTRELLKLNFDGYSIGGFGLGETIKEEFNIVKLCKSILPENKPVYLMGIGNPVEILEAVSHGCDIFDSRMPTQNARRGLLFTSKGKLRIMRKEHEFSKKPIDENCDCYVCKNYTRAYLRHMLMQDESTGKILVTFHNLYYLQDLVRKAKEHIKNGTFNKFLEKVKKAYKE
jgi:queuine tRNA-ribosyltransferase